MAAEDYFYDEDVDWAACPRPNYVRCRNCGDKVYWAFEGSRYILMDVGPFDRKHVCERVRLDPSELEVLS